MKRQILFAAIALSAFVATAQGVGSGGSGSPDEALIEARQAQVDKNASLLKMDLKQGRWTHQEMALCPAFRQHLFVYYRDSGPEGRGSGFLAILPRQGGPVRLIQFQGGPEHAQPIAEQAYAVGVFNSTWREEMKVSHPRLESVDWPGLAACYASITGERLAEDEGDTTGGSGDALPAFAGIGVLVPLMNRNGPDRALSVQFDRYGMVESASVTQAAAPRMVPEKAP